MLAYIRRICGTSLPPRKGSLEFEVVTKALQTLWDEQLLGRRGGWTSKGHEAMVHDAEWEHPDWLEADDSWDTWDDWADETWNYAAEDFTPPDLPEEDDEAIKEAQKAEKIAEGLAVEAQRTWSEAQRATQALRNDRGFGQVIPQQGKGRISCWNCGGAHYAKDCPDRRAPGKGYGKNTYLTEYDLAMVKGKGKSKKGKKGGHVMEQHHSAWMDAQAWFKGKSKSKQSVARPVNAYSQEAFGMEMVGNAYELNSLSTARTMTASQGLLDCGATASAGPQVAVESLVASVLAKDSQAHVEIQQSARPYFRFGNGDWGRALYRLVISSTITGIHRCFKVFTLPNPPGLHHPDFDRSSLVPILVGMDHLSGQPSAMLVDFRTGLAMDSYDIHPQEYQLPCNHKGHYVLDITEYLTRGKVRRDGHPSIKVLENIDHDIHTLEFHPLDFYDAHVVDMSHECGDVEASRSRLHALHARCHERYPPASAAISASMLIDRNSTTPVVSHGQLFVPNVEGTGTRGAERHQGDHQDQEGSGAPRRGSGTWTGSPGSQEPDGSMAMLREPRDRQGGLQPAWALGALPHLRPEASLHTTCGQAQRRR